MSNIVISTALVQYLLFFCIILLYGLFKKDFFYNLSLKMKIILGIFTGIFGSGLLLFSTSFEMPVILTTFSTTIRLFFILFIVIYCSALTTFITFLLMASTFLYLSPGENIYILNFVMIICILVLNMVLNFVYKANELKRWMYLSSVTLVAYFIFLIFFEFTLANAVHYIVYSLFIQFTSFKLISQLKRHDETISFLSTQAKLDYISNVYNYENFMKLMNENSKKGRTFNLVYITIENYSFLQTQLEYKNLITLNRNLGQLLNESFNDYGVVGKINKDQFCIMLHKDIDLLNNIIVNIQKQLNNNVKLSVSYYDILNSKDGAMLTDLNEHLVFLKD